MTTTMTYGSYNFEPVPLVEISKETLQNKDGIHGYKYNLTLNGTLCTDPTGTAGLSNVMALQSGLNQAFSTNGLKFDISCGSGSLLTCYPKLSAPISFSVSNNNWVYTSPYTLELEFENLREGLGENPFDSPFVEQTSENWTLEFVEDSPKYSLDLSAVTSGNQISGQYYGKDCNYLVLRVSHNLNAVGQLHYIDMSGSGTGVSGDAEGIGTTGYITKQAWEYAKDWCIPRLGLDSGVIQDSGVLNLNITGYAPYNHIRATTRSETNGSYSVDESWFVALSGSGDTYSGALKATEDFTVEVIQQAEDDLTQVGVQGSIQGLETRSYGTNINDFAISQTKIESAEAYWNVIKLRLLPRAQLYSQGLASRNINVIPLTKTVGHSPSNGTINYAYTYDDRPNLHISGALTEMISIENNLSTDVVASLPIMGRTAGAIIQSMSTYTNPTLSVNVECTMQRSTGTGLAGLMANIPRAQVNSLLCEFQSDLTGNYSGVYVVDNKENWVPTTAKYTRSMSWLLGICSGTIFSGVC